MTNKMNERMNKFSVDKSLLAPRPRSMFFLWVILLSMEQWTLDKPNKECHVLKADLGHRSNVVFQYLLTFEHSIPLRGHVFILAVGIKCRRQS